MELRGPRRALPETLVSLRARDDSREQHPPFQAVTSIHEQTLSFVPKTLCLVALLVVLLPWMLRTVIQFTTVVIEKLPEMVR